MLNYKGLPYKTEWVEYPDIAGLCKKLGASHTSYKPDGSPHYTLPVIWDPNTNTAVSDSIQIARYLDKTYPGTPLVIPPETDALITVFDYVWMPLIVVKLQPLMLPHACAQLNPVSEEFFRTDREKKYGVKFSEWSPAGPIRDGHWAEVKAALEKLNEFFTADGREKTFVMGDRVTYADIIISGWLVWVKRVLGADGQEWANVLNWVDGTTVGKSLKALERYEVVH